MSNGLWYILFVFNSFVIIGRVERVKRESETKREKEEKDSDREREKQVIEKERERER